MPQDLLDDLAFESQLKNLVISACDFGVYSLSIDLDEKSYVENLDGIKNLLDHINQSLEEVKCEKKIACLKDGWGGYFIYVGTDQTIEEFSKNILL